MNPQPLNPEPVNGYEKCMSKDWGAFVGETKGYAVVAYPIYCKYRYKIFNSNILDSQEFDPICQICYCFDYVLCNEILRMWVLTMNTETQASPNSLLHVKKYP